MLDLFLETGPSLQSFDFVKYMAWKSRNLAQSAIYLDLICYLDKVHLVFQPCKEIFIPIPVILVYKITFVNSTHKDFSGTDLLSQKPTLPKNNSR